MSGRDTPLPYIIVVHVTFGDDTPPMVLEHEVDGYSIEEAIMTAIFETNAHVGRADAKQVVHRARPDLARWMKEAAKRTFAKKS